MMTVALSLDVVVFAASELKQEPTTAAEPAPAAARPLAALWIAAEEQTSETVGKIRSLFQRISEQSSVFDLLPAAPERFATAPGEKFDVVILVGLEAITSRDARAAETADAIVRAVRGGAGILALGHAADSFPDSRDWTAMIGARIIATPWDAGSPPLMLRVVDRTHPSVTGLSETWLVPGPMHQFDAPTDLDGLHVILRIDPDGTDLTLPGIARSDGGFPVSWARYEGSGRVFYSALGGSTTHWDDRMFRDHLLGAIQWVLGRKPGKPLPPDHTPEEFIRTLSGLQYRDIVVGTGASPKKYDRVTVHYIGRLLDGSEFDNSKARGEPLEFTVGMLDVIQGLQEGVLSMHVGGRRKLVIPPELGYGVRGAGPKIPPNSVLVFEVELLSVK